MGTDGVRAATADEELLRGGKEPLSKLYYTMQKIVTDYRHMQNGSG